MRFLIISFLCLSLSLGSIMESPASGDNQVPEELVNLVVETLKPYTEVMKKWIPALVNSPESPTNYNRNSRLDYIDCTVCQAGIDLIKLFRTQIPLPPFIITEVVILGCQILKIVEAPICRGAVTSFAPAVIRIAEKPGLSRDDICGILINGCGKVNATLTNWDINISPTKPAPKPEPPLLDGNVAKTQILQFTDLHLDLDYVEGTNGNCGRPAGCCRDGEGTGSSRAGKFGHLNCSLPLPSLEALFNQAKATTNPKYIFLTGDFIHSAIWLYNKIENTRHLGKVTRLLAETFPDVPIFPVVGNHETDIVNMYPPESQWKDFDLSWMYDLISAPFPNSIPADELSNFKKGGYYTVQPDPEVKFRLVVLNTNLCYLQNFWLPYDTIDPTGQLQWFANTMLKSEQAGETVYILGHISPGSGSCWTVWSEKFDRIIKRFDAIIKGLFYGHAHREYFALTFDKDQKPITASYMGPSGVTDKGNPSFKLYEVDGTRPGATWEIIDHKTYILNLTASNANPTGDAIFEELFSAKKEFGLASLRPVHLYDLVVRMVSDDVLFKAYLRTHHRGVPSSKSCEDKDCRANTLCDLVTTNSGDRTSCNTIRDLVFPPPPKPNPSDGATGVKFTTSMILVPVLITILRILFAQN